MTDQPQAATYEELTARCGHECLSKPDHEGSHFYGYIGGPYSYGGLLARIADLEAGIREHHARTAHARALIWDGDTSIPFQTRDEALWALLPPKEK